LTFEKETSLIQFRIAKRGGTDSRESAR
jgi:hypothetical protein